ncbi:hypothetical protein C8R44DRAFT_988057 [Mycena epipterygia]|nr:hypothetical protein C8R44DRAFT_988057 [Mycena epipterygia]
MALQRSTSFHLIIGYLRLRCPHRRSLSAVARLPTPTHLHTASLQDSAMDGDRKTRAVLSSSSVMLVDGYFAQRSRPAYGASGLVLILGLELTSFSHSGHDCVTFQYTACLAPEFVRVHNLFSFALTCSSSLVKPTPCTNRPYMGGEPSTRWERLYAPRERAITSRTAALHSLPRRTENIPVIFIRDLSCRPRACSSARGPRFVPRGGASLLGLLLPCFLWRALRLIYRLVPRYSLPPALRWIYPARALPVVIHAHALPASHCDANGALSPSPARRLHFHICIQEHQRAAATLEAGLYVRAARPFCSSPAHLQRRAALPRSSPTPKSRRCASLIVKAGEGILVRSEPPDKLHGVSLHPHRRFGEGGRPAVGGRCEGRIFRAGAYWAPIIRLHGRPASRLVRFLYHIREHRDRPLSFSGAAEGAGVRWHWVLR